MMDLCLPDNWEACPGGVFRDDLGPAATVCASQAFVCGLRDWRTPKRPRPMPLRTDKTIRRAPPLVPYHAPAWLLRTQSA